MRALLCLLSLTLVSTAADELVLRSTETRTPLLELFSSEGCSSCPPAERWLAGLDKTPGLWRDYVPISWHVDYWDQLGWRDRFASSAYTERQHAYARAWNSSQVYTPCFVFAGREWRARELPSPTSERAGLLEARIDATHVSVRFHPQTDPTHPREAWLAFLSGPESSAVRAGENAGHTLTHGFIALATAHAKMDANDGAFTTRMTKSSTTSAHAIAVWVTSGGNVAAEQALGAWLPKP